MGSDDAVVDLSRAMFVGGVYSHETLERAHDLVRLSEQADERLAGTLSGMALVCAVANLASVLEHRLILALARSQAAAGAQPDLFAVRQQLGQGGAAAWLRQLPPTELGLNVQFASYKPRPARLVRAVKLRNQLIHDKGVMLSDTADRLDATLEGDNLRILMKIPKSPWERVTRLLGAETVADVEDYLHDLGRFRDQAFLRESDFLIRTVPGTAG